MKKVFIVFLAVICLGAGTRVLGQFTAAELADFEKWEDFLKTAKIVSQEQLTGPLAVTNPWKLTLEKDGVQHRGLWKDVLGERVHGFKETWKGEVAAYRLSRYLGLDMVPPTVEREFQGSRGSCQLWVDSWNTLETILGKKIKTPGPKVNGFFRALFLQRAFDNLIANEDRHQRNYLIMDDWRMILIDHSRSFRTTKKFTTKLIYDEKFKEGPNFIMAELPRAFVDAMKALTSEVVHEVVGEYLTDEEIAATMARRDLIIAWLNKRIAELGEAKVLY
ncbi:MAG: hypothetical protein A2Y86_01475 [Candidatus Aminicenantes bacterium RBG_13_62_12]|nr:MAG: hypothetical protein A2Y86_01475 [Candidatus Aminicenantes bacterium RBG_13_62_12]